MKRSAVVERKTKETKVRIRLNLDGTGKNEISTSMPFLDHMLEVMSKHGFMDLTVQAKGDLAVDYHHTVEDIGIVLGQAIRKAVGSKTGIRRYGTASVPMDEALAQVTLDLSGRPYLIYNVTLPPKKKIRDFDPDLVEHFFQALSNHAGITLHVNVPYGKIPHHILEGIFKGFGKALDQATTIDGRVTGVLSTKGRL
jgi:imidazoleglycerol-phosphate dehydratase